MRKAEILRKKYPQFFYKGYSYQLKRGDLHISFDFAVPPDITFRPRIIIKDIPLPKPSLGRRPKPGLGNLDSLVFHLGLMEIPSYWKATCSPEIVVEAGFLNKEQIVWWKDLFLRGMGEFFFQNKIDFTQPNFLTVTSVAKGKLSLIKFTNLIRLSLGVSLKEQVLVPVGGGKDGVVTLELLKKAGVPLRPFLLNPKPEQQKILSLAKVSTPIIAERAIDPKLLELNRKGYLNGHTPFSAYLAFLTTLAAILFDYKYIAFSNERSSNEGNVKYLGKMINHQYSKSFDFEKKFRQYSKKYLAKDIEYFSFLRPLYELQIARIFARYPKYFPAFLSCNEAHKTKSGTRKPTGKWCSKCAKCLFVFTVLYPFIAEKQLLKIFKKNLFEDKSLTPLMEQLVGKRGFKPFECVGTKKEALVALSLSLEIYMRSHPYSHPPTILSRFKKRTTNSILHSWNTRHFLPPLFSKLLKTAIVKLFS